MLIEWAIGFPLLHKNSFLIEIFKIDIKLIRKNNTIINR